MLKSITLAALLLTSSAYAQNNASALNGKTITCITNDSRKGNFVPKTDSDLSILRTYSKTAYTCTRGGIRDAIEEGSLNFVREVATDAVYKAAKTKAQAQKSGKFSKKF